MCMAANDQFGHQGWIGERQREEQIDYQECRTAVVGSLRGEAPDIAQTHCAACRCHDKAEAGTEFTAWSPHVYTLAECYLPQV